MEHRIRALGSADVEAVSDLLAEAFVDDLAMRYFFPPATPQRDQCLRALFRAMAEIRLARHHPLLGVDVDGTLQAAMGLSTPGARESNDATADAWNRCLEVIPADAAERIDRYGEFQERYTWPHPHHYVVAIGTRPESQGQGYGAALLAEAFLLSQSDAGSAGVCLDTEREENVRWYERRGYEVYAKDRLDETDVWFMVRPSK